MSMTSTASEDALRQEARRFGQERAINPFVALLEEVRRAAGNVVFYEMKVGEAPNDDAMLDTHLVWLKLYNNERDRLTNVAEKAVRLGLEERIVVVEERKAEIMARAFVAALEELGLPQEYLERAPAALRRQLLAIETQSSEG